MIQLCVITNKNVISTSSLGQNSQNINVYCTTVYMDQDNHTVSTLQLYSLVQTNMYWYLQGYSEDFLCIAVTGSPTIWVYTCINEDRVYTVCTYFRNYVVMKYNMISTESLFSSGEVCIHSNTNLDITLYNMIYLLCRNTSFHENCSILQSNFVIVTLTS